MKRFVSLIGLALLVVSIMTGCKKNYTITVKSNNAEWGTVKGSGTYNSGETVSISATPAAGYAFDGWDDGNAENPRNVVVKGDAEYTAVFVASQTEYVDLGLPSGTLWKTSDEHGNGTGFYTYDEAVEAFGDNLPTKEQLVELRNYCTWNRRDNGFDVKGRNGNSMFVPVPGYYDCSMELKFEGGAGSYWSSTYYDTYNDVVYAWALNYNFPGYVGLEWCGSCNGLSVRLVKNE